MTYHSQRRVNHPIVAIGTSTGGPKALEYMITNLPKDFPAPIVIVQHMPKGFTKSLAERLNHKSFLHVKEGEHGEVVEQGNVYIAPGSFHMKLSALGTKVMIELTKEAIYMGHRPSVNTLFQSLAALSFMDKYVVVLTGMGKDGAEGVTQIKERDTSAVIIAESKETAIINGMPQATIDTGLVTNVIPLDKIGKSLTDMIKRGY